MPIFLSIKRELHLGWQRHASSPILIKPVAWGGELVGTISAECPVLLDDVWNSISE